MLNKTRHSLLFSVCFAALSITPATADTSMPEHSFFPKHKWTVERVQLKSDNAPASCVITNEFNNGYVIQISGHQGGFSNINIDFRQNIFQRGFKYEAKYSVPGVSSALVPTKAFKQNLLVSDLRKKQDFFQDILSAGSVDVQIRDNVFRLYMTGLNAAMKNFTACVSPGITMAKVEEPPAPADDVLQRVSDVSSQASPIDQVVKKEKPVIKAPSAMAAVLKPVQEENGKAGVQKAAVSSVESVKADTAKVALLPAPASVDIPEIIDDITAMNEKVMEQSDPVKAHATAKASVHADQQASSTSIKSPSPVYTRDKIVHEHVVDFTKPQKVAQVAREDIDAVQSAAIQPAAGASADHMAKVADKVQALESQIMRLKRENEMLDEELKNVLADAKAERLDVASDNWNLEKATMKFDEAERQIMRLGRQLQSHRAACDLEKAELERMLFDPQLTDQKQIAKLTSLEAALLKAENNLARQQQRYEERIRLLEQRLSAL